MSGANNTERNVLRSFYYGMEKYYISKYTARHTKDLKKHHNINISINYDTEIPECDIAVQFGTAKNRPADHHVTKKSIEKNAKQIVYIETPLLGRVINKKNKYSYYRVGVNGFLYNDGIFYNDENIDYNRINVLRNDLHIPNFTNWRDHKSGEILILLQLPGDSSLRGQKHSEWLMDTIDEIRSITDRPINVRFHPAMSDKGRAEFFSEIGPILFKNYTSITWNDGMSRSLTDDLSAADICVSYTSGSCIDAVLAGVPVISVDEGNLAYPISSHRISDILNPQLASIDEVNNWLSALANSQWSDEEMLTGKVWSHIIDIIENNG